MILRKQLLLIIAITIIAPIGALYCLTSEIVLDGFSKLEQREARKSVERAMNALTSEIKGLEITSADWANWDDIYNFMQGKKPDFLKVNTQKQTFANMKINFTILARSPQQIIFSQGFDRQYEKQIPLPPGLVSNLALTQLLKEPSQNSPIKAQGIFLLPEGEGSLSIVSRSILTSEHKGPSPGTLIFARYLDEKTIQSLASTTHLSITIKRLDDPQLPPAFQAVRPALLKESISVTAIDLDTIAGYTLLKDIYGKPALLMRVDMPRDIYKQGQSSLNYLLWTLLIVGLVFGGAFSAITRSLLQRLEQYITAPSQSKELAEVTLHAIADAVITTNDRGQVESLNPIAEQLTGWKSEEAHGLPIKEVFQIFDEVNGDRTASPVEIVLSGGRSSGIEDRTILTHRDGREFAITSSAVPIRNGDGRLIGTVLVFRDMTSDRAIEHLLSWQASHDPLTKLVNRWELERCVENAMSTAKSGNQQHVMCYLDLDRFKIINDSCGHAAGDELLRQVAMLMQARMRDYDILARLGGDEFGLLLYGCSMEQALPIANRLSEGIQSLHFVWQNKSFAIGVSIGIVAIDADSDSVSSIMSAADVACHVAKEKGCNRIQVYQADDLELVQQRHQMQWLARINRALTEDRFCLYAQSIVLLDDGDRSSPASIPNHCEILLRKVDEKGNIISPATFIPAAERYNLMPAIDRWVVRNLFELLTAHFLQLSPLDLEAHNCNSLYAVNLSGASINDDRLIQFLYEQFELYEVPPQIVCFEITETVAIANLDKAVHFINEFKKLGCRFALDDFGSGMSSFGYLKKLPIDFLKVDGCFIKDILEDKTACAIVQAVNNIAQDMGIQTIAEFVSNEAIFAKVKALGMNYAQGYYIDKPKPLVLNCKIIATDGNHEDRGTQ